MAAYFTKQQKAVLECIAAQGERSVSAAELVDELHRRGEEIGVATVYRQLDKLTQRGAVHKVVTENGAYYSFCHAHEGQDCFLIKCEKCGKIEHMACHNLSPLYSHLAAEHGFAVNARKTMFYGLCALCREEAR
ncbi:MAG: transcriptional repressor [Oscillospiraceae bacterium]|nr:transcriptional repressor [Oscillospiraceae bacterium]